MTIKTYSYNDLSHLNYKEKSDPEFVYNELLELHKSGGKIDLPVQIDRPGVSSDTNLIGFKEFVSRYMEEPEKFMLRLTEEGLIGGLYDMSFDEKTGSIIENKDRNLNQMIQNMDKYGQLIMSSLKKIIDELPKDSKKIKNIVTFDYYGKEVVTDKVHPLYFIGQKFNNHEVYKLIFDKYPEIKKEWKEIRTSEDEEPRFVSAITDRFGHNVNYEVAKLFYKEKIADEYILNNNTLLNSLFKTAATYSDVEFLKEILPKVNLREIEKGKSAYDLSLTRCKTKECAKLLIKNGAVIEQEVKYSSNDLTYTVNVLFAEELKSPEVMDAILEEYPQYKDMDNEGTYRFLSQHDFSFLKLLLEKYNFPKDKYDLMALTSNEEEVKYLKDQGVNLEINDVFLKKCVNDRETGLKLIRQYNKAGLLNTKSPNFISNILKSSPTKAFTTYVEKIEDKHYLELTVNGEPGWWGIEPKSDISRAIRARIGHIEQRDRSGKQYYQYLIENFKKDGFSYIRDYLIDYFNKVKKDNPDHLIDLTYRDTNNNNLFHTLLKSEKYTSREIDFNLFNFIKENSNQDVYDVILEKNNDGKSALTLNIQNTDKLGWKELKVLEDIIENTRGRLDLQEFIERPKGESGTLLSILTTEYKDNPEFSKKIEVYALEDSLKNTSKPTTKKMKI